MEEKNIRELSLDEMDQVTGGIHDTEENRRYLNFDKNFSCPYCNSCFEDQSRLDHHVKNAHPNHARS